MTTTQPRDALGRFCKAETWIECERCLYLYCSPRDDDEHEDCELWVNEDCPGGCHTEHEVDEAYILTCAETGDRWRYCSECGWEEVGRWAVFYPTYINGRYYCDPYMHGFFFCGGCREWMDEDNAHYSERNEEYYCPSCYQPHRGGTEGEDVRTCHVCHTPNLNVHLLTEDYLCDCRALSAHLQGQPVDFRGDEVALRFLTNLRLMEVAA